MGSKLYGFLLNYPDEATHHFEGVRNDSEQRGVAAQLGDRANFLYDLWLTRPLRRLRWLLPWLLRLLFLRLLSLWLQPKCLHSHRKSIDSEVSR